MKKKVLILFSALLILSLLALPAFAEDGGEDGAESNLFGELYAFALEHSSEIFSTLAFAGSVILALGYKRGFLPAMSGALSSLGKNVERIRTEAMTRAENCDGEIGKMLARLSDTEALLATLAEKLSSLDETLGKSEAAGDACTRMKTVMETEIDMLSAIFMGSALPQYQKDMVGERVAAMKAALGEIAHETPAS